MADFTALKTAIQNAIKQNGNEEITGNILQDVLLAIVSTLGDGSINDLITALGSEATTRGNADVTLQQNINAEAQARGNADTALGGRIDGVIESINAINAAIGNGYVYAGIATPSSTPVSGKVFYLALTAGTYTNFGATVVPQGINILKYNGLAWSLDSFLGLDDAPTQGSNNLVKSGGVLDSIIKDGSAFDLSVYNNGTTYADLNAALTALNALPAAYKKGGMSMKFVQTYDNKYVQYRLIADEFTTDTTQWAIADESVYVENPEFIYVKTDAEGKILLAIKADGSIYYGAGVPQQVKDYIEEKISSLSLDEYEDIVAFLSDYLGSDTTLKTLLDTKLDAEGLDPEALNSVQTVENPEFIEVKVDADGKVLYGVQVDGNFYFGAGVPSQIKDSANTKVDKEEGKSLIDEEYAQGVSYIESPEYIEVKTDADDKILEYKDKNGKSHLALPTNQDDKLQKQIFKNGIGCLDIDELNPVETGFNDLESSVDYLSTHIELVTYGTIIKYRNSQIISSITQNPYFFSYYQFIGGEISYAHIRNYLNWSPVYIGASGYVPLDGKSVCVSKVEDKLSFAVNHVIDKDGWCYAAYWASNDPESYCHNYATNLYDCVAKFNVLKPYDVEYLTLQDVARSDNMIADVGNNIVVLICHDPIDYVIIDKESFTQVSNGHPTINGVEISYANLFSVGHTFDNTISSVAPAESGFPVCHINIFKHTDGYFYTTWVGYSSAANGNNVAVLAKSTDCVSWTMVSAFPTQRYEDGYVYNEITTSAVGNYAYLVARENKNIWKINLSTGAIDIIAHLLIYTDERPYSFVIENAVFFALQDCIGWVYEGGNTDNTRKAYSVYCLSKDNKLIHVATYTNWCAGMDIASFEYKHGRLSVTYSGDLRFNNDYSDYPGIPEPEWMFERKGDNDVFFSLINAQQMYGIALANSLL